MMIKRTFCFYPLRVVSRVLGQRFENADFNFEAVIFNPKIFVIK